MGTDPREAGSEHPLLGSTLATRYRIESLLDRGGMGELFVAEDLHLNRRVAVKVIAAHLVSSQVSMERFRREAEIISQLSHPHVVSVLDFDTTPAGQPYLVMELLEGETLEARLARLGPLPFEQVASMVEQVASALAAAHSVGVIHRDLKPGNVFLVDATGETGFVKLLDFGISKRLRSERRITGAFDLIGTPGYMAPEQALAENDKVSAATDQHALAVMAFEALSGQLPFEGDNVASALRAVVEDVPPAISTVAEWPLPPALDAVLARALAKRPGDRFADVVTFAQRFVAAARQEPEDADAPPPSFVSDVWVRARTQPSLAVARATDPAREVIAISEEARHAFEQGRLCEAVEHALDASEMARIHDDAAIVAVTSLTHGLFDDIFLAYLGGEGARFAAGRNPVQTDHLTPARAFVLSRIDGLTVSEALDVSATPRHETLESLAALVRDGLVASDQHDEAC